MTKDEPFKQELDPVLRRKESQLGLEKIQLEKIQEEDLLEDKKISPVKPSKLSKIKEKINKYTQKN